MTYFRTLWALCLFTIFSLSVQAGHPRTMNEPDSVYLFSYSHADGRSGLKFAWSTDGEQWFSIGAGHTYVSSDFGPWGRMKTMFHPHVMQTRADGHWHCLWEVSGSGQTLAYVESPDLLQWWAQRYFDRADLAKYLPKEVYATTKRAIQLDGEEQTGWTQRVAYSTVEQLVRFAEQKRYRQSLYDERTEQDPVRFAGLKPIEATIRVEATRAKAISPHLIGIFFEDINYAADGGLYAELVQNRDFEYSETDGGREKDWGPKKAWTLRQTAEGASFTIESEQPLHPNNAHYAALEVPADGAVTLLNNGYDGIALQRGAKYDFSLFGKVLQGKGGKVKVSLLDESGEAVAEAVVNLTSATWKQQKVVLTSRQDVKTASLALQPLRAGRYALDMVSLFPQATFRGHKNGLRADLAQTLADLKPRFVRFPGGCVAHGDGVDNIYDWKGSIGPLEARKPLRNLWGYHQTRGLGYFEYFQFCEDMGAEPVPVLAAGVPCQNSGTCAHHSHGELGCNGQQGGLPMEEMPAYIQDVLDLIEYANGDARTTEWGRKRAEAGHPKPFNLKFIGIGNEDMITEVFEERFKMIYQAVRERHPEITVIGTVGPFYEGTDYTEGWRLASELKVPMVDEHYYVNPGWMIYNQDYYDRYDRSKSKVYLGEYAAHLPGRPNNVETALAEALYLTAVERNADVVSMSSYAPLLAKEGHTQWNPDLIYFNNNEVKPTVGYYTQQMYGQNAGTSYLPSVVTIDNQRPEVKARIGVSVVQDETSGDYIVKLVNLLPVEVRTQVALKDVELGATPTAVRTILSGHPADKQVRSVSAPFALSGSDFPYTMPAYSFTVIRISQTQAGK